MCGLGAVFFEIMLYWVIASPAMASQVSQIMRLIPPAMRKVLGEENLGFYTPLGLMSLGYTHPFIYVLYLAFPSALFSREIASARDKGILELILSQPLSRRRYLSTLVIFFLAGMIFIAGCIVGGVALSLMIFDIQLSLNVFLPVIINQLVVFAFWGAVSLFVCAVSNSSSTATGWMVGLPLLMFFLDFLGRTIKIVGAISFINPFYYYNPQTILTHTNFPLSDVLILAVSALLVTILSFYLFYRRDL